MKLSELVKKESLRTGEEIHIEKPKFKKERNWLEDNVETKANLSIEKNIDKESKNAKSVEKISLKYVKDVEKDLNYRKPILKIENKLSSKHRKDIIIYREKDNIDLLIVDEANKVLFVIENKVFASERTFGDDGGQLQKYEDIVNHKYSKEYRKYFIFLTIDLT